MRRLIGLFTLLALLLAMVPATPALASGEGSGYWSLGTNVYHHGMIDGPECGTREVHLEQDLTKGRTDGMVYSVDHSVGCKRYIMSNLSPAGIGEMQGNEGQMARCIRYGQEDTARLFDLYYHSLIDPASVKVTCTRYSGRD